VSVYVDQLRHWGWAYGKSCHLIADSLDELHEVAKSIGVRREWFQEPPRASVPHYDLTAKRRAAAVAAGAIECTRTEFVGHVRRLRSLAGGKSR
jgi:hypothetical protein